MCFVRVLESASHNTCLLESTLDGWWMIWCLLCTQHEQTHNIWAAQTCLRVLDASALACAFPSSQKSYTWLHIVGGSSV